MEGRKTQQSTEKWKINRIRLQLINVMYGLAQGGGGFSKIIV